MSAIDRLRGRFLIDTNILIYATLDNDHRAEISREVVARGGRAANQAFVSAQNLAEMYPNLTGPKKQPPDTPAQASEKIRRFAGLPWIEVLPVTASVVRRAIELSEKYHVRRQQYYDMQLAATLLVYDIPVLITENVSDFEKIADIEVINPFA